jgi:hypothetical protein
MQQGQVFRLKGTRANGSVSWAFWYRVGGRGARRRAWRLRFREVAAEGFERALERLRREYRSALQAAVPTHLPDPYDRYLSLNHLTRRCAAVGTRTTTSF